MVLGTILWSFDQRIREQLVNLLELFGHWFILVLLDSHPFKDIIDVFCLLFRGAAGGCRVWGCLLAYRRAHKALPSGYPRHGFTSMS